MPAPELLVRLAEPWAAFHAASAAVAIGLTFAHLAALVVAGGAAIAADRLTLAVASGDAGGRARHLETLGGVHRIVIPGLALSVASGALLFLTDVETYWSSRVYWGKLGLVLLLLANGLAMRAVERRAATGPHGDVSRWRALRASAWCSLALWAATTLLGVVLVNAA